MSSSPFRTRRLSRDETRRVLKRATELAELQRVAEPSGESFTEAELAQRLTDLGLPDDAIRRAMTDPSNEAPVPVVDATRVTREEEIEGMLPADRHEAVADAISKAMQLPGRIEVVGGKLKWTMGILMDPSVTVHSKDGRTRISIVETLANNGQLIIGAVTAATFAALFGTVPGIGLAKLLGDSAANAGRSILIVAAFAIASALLAVAGVRRLFQRRVRTRTHAIDAAMDHIATVVRDSVVVPEQKPRIAVPARNVPNESALDAEAEDEAEAALETPEAKSVI